MPSIEADTQESLPDTQGYDASQESCQSISSTWSSAYTSPIAVARGLPESQSDGSYDGGSMSFSSCPTPVREFLEVFEGRSQDEDEFLVGRCADPSASW